MACFDSKPAKQTETGCFRPCTSLDSQSLHDETPAIVLAGALIVADDVEASHTEASCCLLMVTIHDITMPVFCCRAGYFIGDAPGILTLHPEPCSGNEAGGPGYL